MSREILALARPELIGREPYRPPTVPPGLIRLHSNESPWPAPGTAPADALHRYPSLAATLEKRMAEVYEVAAGSVLATRGSNDGIDLLVRAFCRAGQDAVLTLVPTFAMYAEFAAIQNAAVVTVQLDAEAGFAVDVAAIVSAWRPGVKLVFLCSPNNPTGSVVDRAALCELLERLADRAVVVVDEAYIEFASVSSASNLIAIYPNLVIVRTLSKGFGLAGARVGALLAQADVIGLLRSILPPYALPDPVARLALTALTPDALSCAWHRAALLGRERDRVADALQGAPNVHRVWRGEGNFLLVDTDDRDAFVAACREGGVLVRAVHGDVVLRRAVRITIGTGDENDRLLAALGIAAPSPALATARVLP